MDILVQVHQPDRNSLADFEAFGGRHIDSRRLDGVAWASIMVTVTPAVASVLRTWLSARYTQQAKTRVVVNGKIVEGFSATEVERLLKMITNADPGPPLSDAGEQ